MRDDMIVPRESSHLWEIEDVYPLSDIEKGMVFHSLMDPGVYYRQSVYLLKIDNFSPAIFQEAFALMVEKHPILRTGFNMQEYDQPVQIVYREIPLCIPHYDLSGQERVWQNAKLIQIIAGEKEKRFNFETAEPLWRARTFDLGNNNILFLWIAHHAMIDGWSTSSLLTELNNTYFQLIVNPQYVPVKLKSTYKEFVIQEVLDKRKPENIAFWKKELEGYKRLKFPAIKSEEKGARILKRDLSYLHNRLLLTAKVFGTSLKHLCFGAYAFMLNMLSYDNDIVVGLVVGNRPLCEDGEKIIGCFLNTLPVRMRIPVNEIKWPGYIRVVHDKMLELMRYERISLFEITRLMGEEKQDENPFFDVIFNFVDFYIYKQLNLDHFIENPLEGSGKDGGFFTGEENSRNNTLFDFTVNAGSGGLEIVLTYDISRVADELAERLCGYFEGTLEKLISDPHGPALKYEVMREEEKQRLLYHFNDTDAQYPETMTIHGLFAAQVQRTPDGTALVGSKVEQLTYGKLNQKSNQLAHLLKEKGVGPDVIVGIMVERSVEMIIGILAILKAGGAYLPIDPGYPQERINYMLSDSNAKISLTSDAINRVPTPHHLHLSPVPATSLAYIIYTSGSTGKPKGVMLRHRSVVNRINWMQRAYPLGTADVILQKTTYVFDVSIWELFWWSFVGASLCLLGPGEEKNPEAILDAIAWHNITTLHFVPSMLNVFLEYIELKSRVRVTADRLACLRQVFCSGEALMTHQVKRFYRLIGKTHGIRLVNLYGPTEAAVDVSYYNCHQKEHPDNIPIGRPIDNIRLYVLDRNADLQPLGVVGELCIGGVGLAKGYLNRPELTNEKFLRGSRGQFFQKEPPGRRRLYKTGDLARWLLDGNIEFLGRIDHQVKIRGFRIELGEIETQLSSHVAVKEAVVVARQEDRGDKYLCAYVVCVKPGSLESGQLRDYLSQRLPHYMVPAYFVVLEELPLTPNGKVNRKALPVPEETGFKAETRYAAPRDAVEKKLVDVWCEVLGRDRIGIHDNFFAIGGDSIKIIQVSSRMNIAGYKIGVGDIFRNPRIADLAPLVKKSGYTADQSVITGEVPLTPIQHFFFRGSFEGRHHYNHSVMFYSEEFLEEKAIKEIFTRVQVHHDALRMTFVERDGKIIQENNGLDHPFSLEVYDLRGLVKAVEELEKRASAIQAGIDLETGPLMKLGLLHLDDGDRLLIVIHHLVVDGVSWRILFEDIETLYRQYQKGQPLALPPKTDSFKRWAEELCKYANGELFLKERKYWQELEASSVPGITKDFDVTENRVKNSDVLSIRLSAEETEKLLTRTNEAYNTEINDILLTALGLGIKKTFGHDKLLIALEGHGREEIIQGFDPGRTIGWFTSIYPVVLDISYENNLARQVKEVKETLRRTPNNGIGHGILKYLARQEYKEGMDFKLKPRICFNYAGQFDTDVGRMSFRIAKESAGNTSDPERVRDYELDISGMVSNLQLVLFVKYCTGHYKTETINKILNNYKDELLRLISFCITRKERELTPADFTYKGLSIEQVDGLCRRFPVEDIYTLSPMQEGMLFHWLYDRESSAYFEQMSFRLHGKLDMDLVKKSLKKLFERHDILRTVFVHEGLERPVQVVLKEGNADFIYKDIREINDQSDKENFVNQYKKKDKQRLFDLSSVIPLRITIIRVAEKEYRFTWSYHHILMDGWCLGIVIAEFKNIYRCYLENKPVHLAVVKPYKNYIEWLENRDKEESRSFWLNYLGGYEETAVIPGAKFSSANREYKAEHMVIDIEKQKTTALNNLSVKRHVTLNTIMQNIWGIVLSKYNDKPDVVFGSVVSGRPPGIDGIETMVGLFINTVPVRIRYEEKTSFYQLLSSIQEEAINTAPHHYLPLAEIQAGSALKQDLLGHIMIFENYPIRQLDAGMEEGQSSGSLELKMTNVEFFEQTNYDFCLGVLPGSRVQLVLNYNANAYDSDFIEGIARHIQLVIHRVTGSEDVYIREITLISEQEKHRILMEFNNTAVDFPGDKTLHRLFEEQAARTPDSAAAVGVTAGGTQFITSVTYRELNQKANQAAHLLRQRGVQPDVIVGIMVERSMEMIIGILGILKAGGAYLPIDPGYPRERINYMLSDSNAKISLTSDAINHVPTTLYLHLPPTPATSLAYVIYTSGSTGQPKGVLVSHSNAVNTVTWFGRSYGLGSGRHVLQMSDYTFDPSVNQFFGTLLFGAVLHIIPGDLLLDSGVLRLYINRHQIHILNFVPVMLNELLGNKERLESVQVVLSGGEKLDETIKDRIIGKGYTLYNQYGPTETTIDALVGQCGVGPVTLGKPISNTQVYVLNKNLCLQPVGIPGELCISGEGTARGYLNRPELTAEKFCLRRPGGALFEKTAPPGPPRKNFLLEGDYQDYHDEEQKGPGERIQPGNNRSSRSYKSYALYKTGDLARWLPDGRIEFLGRNDRQVKVRGFRVELGEIEKALMQYKNIETCIVEISEADQITAYIKRYPRITLRPSWAEQFVYDDMAYFAMVSDDSRNQKYRNVFKKVLKDKVVLEIGPGSDICLTRLCTEAGAKKVYAVEILKDAFQKAKQKVESLGLEHKVQLIHGDVTEISLPEPVDYCVSEIVGSVGGMQGAAKIINSVRHMLKNPLCMIPSRSLTKIAGITLPAESFDYTFDEVGAHYTRKIFEKTGYKFDLRLCLLNLPKQHVISTADTFEDLNFQEENVLEDEHNIYLEIKSNSILNGLIAWLILYIDENETIDTLGREGLWLPLYFPVFSGGAAVKKGDYIKGKVTRKLSGNGLNPDYLIEGALYRQGEAPLEFSYNSFNQEPVFRADDFYRKVFSQDGINPGEKNDPVEMKAYLNRFLPEYMVPAHFVELEEVPLTPNGKVDRKALPSPGAEADMKKETPRSVVEEKLAQIWSGVLGIEEEKIGTTMSFFRLGGHSLKATALISCIHKELEVKITLAELFKNPTIREQADYINGTMGCRYDEIEAGEKKDYYPLSYNQMRLWFIHRMHPDSPAYNITGTVVLDHKVEEENIKKVLHGLMERHESFRTAFREVNHEPVQVVGKNLPLPLKVIDISSLKGVEQQQRMETAAAELMGSPFDLGKAPLFQALLLKPDEEHCHLLFNMHHIVSDGWSMEILTREFMQFYDRYTKGENLEPGPLRLQYRDFVKWQNRQLTDPGVKEKALGFWRTKVQEGLPGLNWHREDSGKSRNPESAGYWFAVRGEVKEQLKQLALEHHTSIFVVLFSALNMLLSRLSHQEEILTGILGAGRGHVGLQDIVGFFINTLVIKQRVEPGQQFPAFLQEVNRSIMETLQHQDYPLELVLEELNMRFPGISVMFNLFNLNDAAVKKDIHDFEPYHLDRVRDVKFEMVVSAAELNNGLEIRCHYRKDVFQKERVEFMMQEYRNLLEGIAVDPTKSLKTYLVIKTNKKKLKLAGN